jgi:hypothetical protein
MYYVKLIKNKSFYFFNHRFIHGKEEQVDEKKNIQLFKGK